MNNDISQSDKVNKSQIKFAEYEQKDWRKLRDLYLQLLKNDPDAFADEYDDVFSRTEEDWQKIPGDKGKTFIALDQGEFIAMGRINFYEELPNTPVLHKLGVLLRYRGLGIARVL